MVSVGAWYLLHRRHRDFALASVKTGLGLAGVAAILSLVTGDGSARGVVRNQPAKFAAFEGLWQTTPQAPLQPLRLGGRDARPDARACWDAGFAGGSFVSTLLIGVAMGNIAWGVPLDARGEFAGSFLGLLNPYALLMGATTVALFAMHGAIYLVLKTEGELQARVRRWVNPLIIAFILCYVILTLATLLYVPHITEAFGREPWFFAGAVAVVLAIANIPREVSHRREFFAFVSSCGAMAGLMAIFGLGMYPNLVFCHTEPAHSLTAFNAASSEKALGIMLTIALLGIPVVLAYSASIYWIFRGKVKLDRMSY